MSGFNNNPFHYTSSNVPPVTTSQSTLNASETGIFTNAAMPPPPPYSAPTSTTSFSSNFQFQNSPNKQTTPFMSTFRNSSQGSPFRVDSTRPNVSSVPGSFQLSPSKNLIGPPLFSSSSFQMPRPASLWSTETKPKFSFAPSLFSKGNSAETTPLQTTFRSPAIFGSSVPSPTNTTQSPQPLNEPPARPAVVNNTVTSKFTPIVNQIGYGNPFAQTSQPFTLSNNVFGTVKSDETANPQSKSSSVNLWMKPASENVSKATDEDQAKDKKELVRKLDAEETSPESLHDKDSKKRYTPRQQRKPSVTSTRRSPGLFNKALAGIGTRSTKPSTSSTQIPKSPTEKSKESKRRSSVKSSDGFVISPEELQTFTTIVCKDVPNDLNNKQTFLAHFGRFGIVRKIICYVQKQSATITFQTHQAAAAAKTSGKILRPDREPIAIFWSRPSSSRSGNDASSPPAETGKSEVKPSRTSGSSKKSLKYQVDDDVSKELKSMSASTGNSLVAPKLLERPKVPKHQSASTEAQNLAPHLVQESAAKTSHDKYTILDNDDKALRTGLKKQSNLATARAIVGTCLDMCPEKERYMREDRGQLHLYEVLTPSMNGETLCDHRKAIKEYSRSSADQEEPLPHELRPPKILAMTMDYLVCNIMDLYENSTDNQVSAADWYDFVWNRTRSLRKDITQQHLSDGLTVEVVEKCARFHIHCSARLCEEDMMTFDQKYNNENLTNCLQTLKHMYADLRAKGMPCKNEAEFIAYDLLLNLNEGSIIRQISLVHDDVQQAAQVRLALECANAICGNNYVRFFKLVRRASYLTACILQRYFNQVRIKGFQGFVKAYCPNPSYYVQFPIKKLITWFGFDDHGEVTEFVSFHNLVAESDFVVLDRSRFSAPESAIPLKRAKVLIESKRTCSVGELVNGGPLPINPTTYYEPQISFDEVGFLKRESNAHHHLSSRGIEQKAIQILPRKEESEWATDSSNKMTEEIAAEIIVEITSQLVDRTARTDLNRYLDFAKNTTEMAKLCLHEVCALMTSDVAKEMYNSSRAEELKNRLQKEAEELAKKKLIEKQKEECVVNLLENLIQDFVTQETTSIAHQELKEEYLVCKKQCIERSSSQLLEQLCNEWMHDFLEQMCCDVHAIATQYRKGTLERVSYKLATWKSAEFVKIWRSMVMKRKRLRSSMELFPSSVLCSSFLTKSSKETGSEFSKLNLTSPLQFEESWTRVNKLLDINIVSEELQDSIRQSCIDLNEIARRNVYFGKHMTDKWRRNQHVYWKLLVTSSGIQKSEGFLSTWLQNKFSTYEPDPTLSEVVSAVSYSNNQRPSSAVSIKFIQQPNVCTGRTSLFKGTHGIVFVLEFPENSDFYSLDTLCAKGRQSLFSLLKEVLPDPVLPLLIVIVCNNNKLSNEDISRRLNLDALLERDMISEFMLIQLSHKLEEPTSTQVLTEGLRWLGNNCPPAPPLVIQDANQFVNKTVADYFTPLLQHLHPQRWTHFQCINAVIDLFNCVILHAANCVSHQLLTNISYPPAEFVGKYSDLPSPNWNSEQELEQKRSLISSFCLPPFEKQFELSNSCSDISSLLWDHIDQLQDTNWSNKMFLCARIQRVLEKVSWVENGDEMRLWQLLPWKDIVQILVDYQCTVAPIDVDVVYHSGTYSAFTTSPQLNLLLQNQRGNLPTVKRKVESSPATVKKRVLVQDVFKEPDPLNELKKSSLELKRQLEIERLRSIEFEKYLNQALNG